MADIPQNDLSLPPKVVVSSGQAIDSPKVLDLKSAAYPKLLAGAWITFLLFILFSVFDWLGNVRKDPVEFWVLYSEFSAAACAFLCAMIAFLFPDIKATHLYRMMYAMLVATAFFMTMYEVQEFRAAKWKIPVPEEHQSQVLEPVVDSVAFRWFIVIVCYGIFVPDPRTQKRKGKALNQWRRLRTFLFPDRRLAAVLNVLALWPLLLLAGIAAKDGTLPLFARPAFEMMLWLVLARLVARYGPYQFDQLEDRALDLAKEGRYTIKEKIGEGGMGDVYLAEDQLLNRPCAYKAIRPKLIGVAKVYDRFQREVNITAKLYHPNIVSIFDFGRNSSGTYYYAMEYVPGLSLKDLVELEPLPPGRVVYVLRQVCQALRTAHTLGFIHRDIKPANIMVARPPGMDEVAKLLDFGLGKNVTLAEEAALTELGSLLGTPQWMAPEQAEGDDSLDKRIDIYSLGAVAYFLLTGSAPFGDKKAAAALSAHLREAVIPPSQHRPEIPHDLETIVLKCLEKNPDCRFQDARSLEVALSICACARAWDEVRMDEWWNRHPGPYYRPSGPASPTI